MPEEKKKGKAEETAEKTGELVGKGQERFGSSERDRLRVEEGD